MKILGLDTSSKFLSLGASDGRRACEVNVELGIRHSALLIPLLNKVLAALGWRPEEIDYFACGRGPGSFTGIRVGMAAVKGLCLSLSKPAVAVPTLDILARGIMQDAPSVVPAIDAKRGLIYCSAYQIKNGILKRKAPYMLLSPQEFCRRLPQKSLIFGDALLIHKEKLLSGLKGAVALDNDYWYPKGRNIIYLAREMIRGRRITDAFGLEPIYLYPKECQVRKVKSKN